MAYILIADDLAVIRDSVAFALEGAGHETISAGDGLEALCSITARIPDLIILDIEITKTSGLDVLRTLHADEHLAGIPVLILTGANDLQTVEQAASLGADQYLLKSAFSIDELLLRVSTLLAGPADETPLDAQAAATNASPDIPAKPVLKPHKPANNLSDYKPVIRRSDFRERVMSFGALTAMSPAATQILKLCRSDASTPEEIAKLVRKDPALAIKLLKLANSSAHSTGESVESIDRAVVLVGTEAIEHAILAINVVDSFKELPEGSPLDIRHFWEHSLVCAIIAARLARITGSVEPAAAFTTGLIHDIGRLVYLQVMPDEYAAVLQAAVELGEPAHLVESRMLLMNHAEGIDELLLSWKFPRDLIDPVVYHHIDPDQIRAKSRKRHESVSLLCLADRLAHALGFGVWDADTLQPIDTLADTLGLTAPTIAEAVAGVDEEADDMKLTMLSQCGGEAWKPRLASISMGVCSGFELTDARDCFTPDSRVSFLQRLSCSQEPCSRDLFVAKLAPGQSIRSGADSHSSQRPLVLLSKEVSPEEQSQPPLPGVLNIPETVPVLSVVRAIGSLCDASSDSSLAA